MRLAFYQLEEEKYAHKQKIRGTDVASSFRSFTVECESIVRKYFYNLFIVLFVHHDLCFDLCLKVDAYIILMHRHVYLF